MPTRNPVKTWFCTFPKWEEVKRKTILTLLPSPTDYCICQETHKDGGNHYHALFRCLGITHAQLLKHFQKVYPDDWKRIHFKPVRSVKQALLYCHKEDSSPLKKGFSGKSDYPTVNEFVRRNLNFKWSCGPLAEFQKKLKEFIKQQCCCMNIDDKELFKDVAEKIGYNNFCKNYKMEEDKTN